jgi:hypothetical protein
VDHGALVGLVAAFTAAVAAGGATAVVVDASPEAYLSRTGEWRFYEGIDREYEIGETVVVALRETGGTVFDVETVTAVAELDRILSTSPSIERVLSMASATSLQRAGDVVDLRPLLPSPAITPDVAIALGNAIREHPLYNELLVDDRHEAAYIFVQLAGLDPVKRLEAVREIRDEADRFASMGRSIHLAGSAVTKEAIAAGVSHDAVLFFPAALILLMVLLWVMFNDLIASIVPLVVVGYAAVAVVGLLAFAGTSLNMATASVPTIILVVGLADAVHFLAELDRQYARSGDRRSSILATIEAIALPALLTSSTAAVAFLALVSSSVAPLRELGYATAIGLFVAHGASMTLLPALLVASRYPRTRTRPVPTAPMLGRTMGRFAELAHGRLVATIGAAGLLFGVCVAGVAHLEIDSDLVRYLDEDHRLRRDIAVIERTLGGTGVIEVVIDSDETKTFQSPRGLEVLDRLGERLRKFEGVSRVVSLADYLSLANAVMEGRDPGERRLPASNEAVAQLALLDPTAFSALSNEEMSQARMSLQIRWIPSGEVLALVDGLREATADELGDTKLAATFSGLPLLFAQIVKSLVDDVIRSFGIGAVLIFIAMLLGFWSPATAVATMVPTILTVGLTFGAMTVLGMPFDTNSAFIACVGWGIALHNTLHLASRYQRAREEGSPSPLSAVQYAISHAGHPMVMAALMLAVGFSVLCLSSFKPTFRAGVASVLLVGFGGVLNLCLFPALLMAADRLERRYEERAGNDARFREVSSILTGPPTKREGSK